MKTLIADAAAIDLTFASVFYSSVSLLYPLILPMGVEIDFRYS